MFKSRYACVLMAVLFMFLAVGAGASAEIIPVTLADGNSACDAEGVDIQGDVVSVTKPGEYMFSGTLTNGQIFVDCREDGKVTLHLNGAVIHNETGPAIQVGHVSPRLRVSLASGTENALSNGKHLVFENDDEPNGVLFSRSDLTIEGSGSLTVSAGDYDGIVSKDDLRIEGGAIQVEAPRHGIRGKDSVEIEGGTLSIRCGKDGLRSTNTKDPEKGYISITGGEINIVCGDDPLDFITALYIRGGIISSTVRSSEAEDEP